MQALVENCIREDMNDADKRDGIQKLKALGLDRVAISLVLGKSIAWVDQLSAITDGDA